MIVVEIQLLLQLLILLLLLLLLLPLLIPPLELEDAAAAASAVLHHWELSVKFLLFVGSWDDALAIFSRRFHPTQSSSSSSSSSTTTTTTTITTTITTTTTSSSSTTISGSSSSSSSSSSGSEAAPDWLLGQYLGPHVGESLRDRKERLSRQLLLGKHGYGAQLITRMYGVEVLGGRQWKMKGVGRVVGWMGLQRAVEGKRYYPRYKQQRCYKGTCSMTAAGDTAAAAAGTGAPASGAAFYGECAVFPWHWYGWWTHDAAAMVQLPKHAHSPLVHHAQRRMALACAGPR
ncbi:hypothetical protein CLOP_g1593 [Closterium sp. NIES-67]|nr:hypothetical protein CLOP_g1593 [Closterium sp. NIES-67]